MCYNFDTIWGEFNCNIDPDHSFSYPKNLAGAFHLSQNLKNCPDFSGYLKESSNDYFPSQIKYGEDLCAQGKNYMTQAFKNTYDEYDKQLKIFQIEHFIKNSTCCVPIPANIPCRTPYKSKNLEFQLAKFSIFDNEIKNFITCVENTDDYGSAHGAQNDGQGHSWTLYQQTSCGNISECTKHIPSSQTSQTQDNKLEVPSTLGDLNKMGNVKLQVLIGKGIKLLMQVIGTIALLMFVYGGLLWMVSAGNTEKTKKAMDIMLWAGLGVIVILSSYAIVNFVFGLVR